MNQSTRFPDVDPEDSPEALWTLQQELLSLAESVLGSRDTSKIIYQPQFVDDGPQIRNTPSLDGAFVELSRNGERYWPTVVYEMAHETIHLLNPIPGDAKYIEEGVAVEFSLWVQPLYGIVMETTMESYLYALGLVRKLPGGPLDAGRRVRDNVGALSRCTWRDLTILFPEVEPGILEMLASDFIREPGR